MKIEEKTDTTLIIYHPEPEPIILKPVKIEKPEEANERVEVMRAENITNGFLNLCEEDLDYPIQMDNNFNMTPTPYGNNSPVSWSNGPSSFYPN